MKSYSEGVNYGGWYNINRAMGNDWAKIFILTGDRDCGKSYSAVKWGIGRKLKLGENMKFYWLRLTGESVKSMLQNNADKLIDADLLRKFNIKIKVKGSQVWLVEEVERVIARGKNAGKTVVDIKYISVLCEVYDIGTFYKNKGSAFYDNEFNGEYFIMFDEMNRESSEKKTFDIVLALANQLENMTRDTKAKVRLVMIGNNIGDASDVLSALRFIPDSQGVYKLKRRGIYIENIRDNEAYQERRKDSLMHMLLGNKATKKRAFDLKRIVSNYKHPRNPIVVDFGREKFAYHNGVISHWQCYQTRVPFSMTRNNQNGVYDKEFVKTIKDFYEKRHFKFDTLSTQKSFEVAMSLIIPK